MIAQRFTIPLRDHLTARDAAAAERALAAVPGVVHAYASPPTEMAYVTADESLANPMLLFEAVERLGLGAGVPGRR